MGRMNYTAYEQSKIDEAKEGIREAKATLRSINEARQMRLKREEFAKTQARQNMEAGVKAMVDDIKKTAPIGYNAALDTFELHGLWTGTMTMTLVFKPLV